MMFTLLSSASKTLKALWGTELCGAALLLSVEIFALVSPTGTETPFLETCCLAKSFDRYNG
jgi:hypothetical protein